MLKKVALIGMVVLVSACSTFKGTQSAKVEGTDSHTSQFLGGEVKLTFTKAGEFESITSTGSARITSTLPSAMDEAFIMAKLRAQQKIVEFIKSELDSEHFKQSIFESLQEGETENGKPTNETKSKVAYNVKEDIKTKSKGILKGVLVESKQIDTTNGIILVTVRTGVKEIDSAGKVSKLMGN